MKMLVSIIMAAYNAETTIQRSIESVLKQLYQNFELIIIDDGSTDSTAKIVHECIQKDARIRVFHQVNAGVGSARNKGLSEMKGDYFCFLDADDVMSERSIIDRLEIFEKDASVSFVDGVVEERRSLDTKVVRTFVPDFLGNPWKELILLKDSCFCGQTWMIKRDFERKYAFRTDVTHGEDLLFFIELSSKGGTYAFTNEVILTYIRSDNSAMGNIKGLEKFYQLHLKNCEGLNLKGDLSSEELGSIRRKVRSILWKSYLKQRKVLDTIRIFSEYKLR